MIFWWGTAADENQVAQSRSRMICWAGRRQGGKLLADHLVALAFEDLDASGL